jgi:hypothetical protein
MLDSKIEYRRENYEAAFESLRQTIKQADNLPFPPRAGCSRRGKLAQRCLEQKDWWSKQPTLTRRNWVSKRTLCVRTSTRRMCGHCGPINVSGSASAKWPDFATFVACSHCQGNLPLHLHTDRLDWFSRSPTRIHFVRRRGRHQRPTYTTQNTSLQPEITVPYRT